MLYMYNIRMASNMKARNKFFELKTLTKPNPKSLIARISIIIGLFVLEQVALSVLTVPIALDNQTNSLPVAADWVAIFFAALLFALFIYITWRCFKVTSPKGDWKLLEEPTGRHLLWVLIGFVSIFLVSLLVSSLSSLLQSALGADGTTTANQSEINNLVSGTMRPSLIVLLIFIALLGPIAEELIFRGLLMNYFFANSKNRWLGIILSAVVFGSIHLFGESSIVNALIGMLIYGGMGLVLALVYRKTGKIQYSMMVHILWNTQATIIMIFQM